LEDSTVEKQKRAAVMLGRVDRTIAELERFLDAAGPDKDSIVASIRGWIDAGKPH
jgi:hypothetical protein